MRIFKRPHFHRYVFSERTIIAWMMAAAIIPMLCLAFFAYKRAESTLESAISNALFMEINKKVDEINNNIAVKKINLLQLSELPELSKIINEMHGTQSMSVIEPKRIKDFSDYLNYITPRLGVSDVYIVNMDAQVIYSLHPSTLLGKQLDVSDLYHAFDGARVLGMPYIYTAFHGENVSGLSIYLSNLINGKEASEAVLIMKLDPYYIKKVVEMNFGYTKSDETILGMRVDSKPTVVISTDSERFPSHSYSEIEYQLLTRALSGEMAMSPINIWKEGRSSIAIYSYVPQLNMGMVVEYDKADAYWKMDWLRINMLAITLIDLLMVVMIVLWIARSLRDAHRKSELLLENILPKFVVNELKEKKQFLARHVQHVSILFIDIMNFTPFAAAHPPEEVIIILDELFSMFDNLCDHYQLEKIKTIGDAYMAVAGLISPQTDHAERAVNMGLDAIEAVKQYNLKRQTNFSIRVGIDSGDVIAGIIGKKKFSYDLWGNSVNFANRMESTDISNEVQISLQTYDAIVSKSKYQFNLRQNVAIKGYGNINTYLVSRVVS